MHLIRWSDLGFPTKEGYYYFDGMDIWVRQYDVRRAKEWLTAGNDDAVFQLVMRIVQRARVTVTVTGYDMRELFYLLILPVLAIILLAYYFLPDQKLWGRSHSSWVTPPGIERLWRNFWR